MEGRQNDNHVELVSEIMARCPDEWIFLRWWRTTSTDSRTRGSGLPIVLIAGAGTFDETKAPYGSAGVDPTRAISRFCNVTVL